MGTINIAKTTESPYCIRCIICGGIREQQEMPRVTHYSEMICDGCRKAILKVRAAIDTGRLDI